MGGEWKHSQWHHLKYHAYVPGFHRLHLCYNHFHDSHYHQQHCPNRYEMSLSSVDD